MSELSRVKFLLSNCAYWAINALGVVGSLRHINEIQKVSLENILKISGEFAIHRPDGDSRVIYKGIAASLVPEEGWPEPKRKWVPMSKEREEADVR